MSRAGTYLSPQQDLNYTNAQHAAWFLSWVDDSAEAQDRFAQVAIDSWPKVQALVTEVQELCEKLHGTPLDSVRRLLLSTEKLSRVPGLTWRYGAPMNDPVGAATRLATILEAGVHTAEAMTRARDEFDDAAGNTSHLDDLGLPWNIRDRDASVRRDDRERFPALTVALLAHWSHHLDAIATAAEDPQVQARVMGTYIDAAGPDDRESMIANEKWQVAAESLRYEADNCPPPH